MAERAEPEAETICEKRHATKGGGRRPLTPTGFSHAAGQRLRTDALFARLLRSLGLRCGFLDAATFCFFLACGSFGMILRTVRTSLSSHSSLSSSHGQHVLGVQEARHDRGGPSYLNGGAGLGEKRQPIGFKVSQLLNATLIA